MTAAGGHGYREPMSTPPHPRLAFVDEGDVPWQEVLAERHGDHRVSVHEKFLEWTPDRMVVLGRYDGYRALLRARGIERLPPPHIVRPASAPGGRDTDPPTYG